MQGKKIRVFFFFAILIGYEGIGQNLCNCELRNWMSTEVLVFSGKYAWPGHGDFDFPGRVSKELVTAGHHYTVSLWSQVETLPSEKGKGKILASNIQSWGCSHEYVKV